MTDASRSDPAVEKLHLRELISLAAQRAARVLGEFAGTEVIAGPLRTGRALKTPPFETGVIFRVEGRLEGHLAFCLDPLARRALIRLLLDEDEPEAPPDMVASALSELANIVASQAVSAVADAVGGVISLSVPELALERAAARLWEVCGERESDARDRAFISEISAPGSGLRVLLVIAPDL
jgi:chemotaxis protein CheY-P-specific phosphatase CheC